LTVRCPTSWTTPQLELVRIPYGRGLIAKADGPISAHFSEFEIIIGFDVDNRENIHACVLHSRMF
ncbi:MAG: hypothetical protein ABLT11_07175, partial [Candidatus Acidiferrum sp.]